MQEMRMQDRKSPSKQQEMLIKEQLLSCLTRKKAGMNPALFRLRYNRVSCNVVSAVYCSNRISIIFSISA